MVESSVYVGATREIFGIFRDKGVFVGFSPERVDPGRTEPPMEEIPKIISGLDDLSLSICKEIYQSVFNKIVPVSSCETAEMCKLYENCFRMVNIAYINEIADVCENNGIDVHEVIDASSTKPFGFMPFRPGIGVGGHCIPVNPYYLFKSGDCPVLKYSTDLMEQRPSKKAQEIVSKYNPKNILITGIGFKKGEHLLTNSPGYALYKELLSLDQNVQVYDPLVQKYNKDILFLDDFSENLSQFDLVITNLPLEQDEQKLLQTTFKKTDTNIYINF
jgi:nucleotide sugar dehydrogenase